MSPVCGILCGGLSRRMGRPKALIPVGGRTLIERTVSKAGEAVDEIVLLGSPAFELPGSLTRLPRLSDRYPGIGPIAGLDSLLAGRPARTVILLSCDLPLLEAPLLRRLCEAATPESDAVAFATRDANEGWEPCCALYQPSIRAAVLQSIQFAQYSLCRLLSAAKTLTLPLGPPETAMLANLNLPEDLRALRIDDG